MITRSCSDISNDSKTQYRLFINTRSQESYANDPGVRHYEWSPDRKRTDNQTIKLPTWYNLLMADFPPTILCLLFYWGSQLVVISHALLSILLLLHWPAGKEEREKGEGVWWLCDKRGRLLFSAKWSLSCAGELYLAEYTVLSL